MIPPAANPPSTQLAGRNLIVVIGIDHYEHWRPLGNAVSDASGARSLFLRLGFEDVVPPLLDAKATRAALDALVNDDLAALRPDDSLVVFYAGHGGARAHDLHGQPVKSGHLIPVDAAVDRISTWINLEAWLRAVSVLPPRHVLVILDACYSGIALDPVIRWRDEGGPPTAPLATLQARSSRRIITSALDDERALDTGPVPGHSLFTGAVIEALTGGIASAAGVVTGSELGVWVRQRVRTYPRAQQTPDFGAFDHDKRGEIMIPLLHGAAGASPPDEHRQARSPSEPARVAFADAVSDPGTVIPASVTDRPPRVAARLYQALQRERDWLLIVALLLVAAGFATIARSC